MGWQNGLSASVPVSAWREAGECPRDRRDGARETKRRNQTKPQPKRKRGWGARSISLVFGPGWHLLHSSIFQSIFEKLSNGRDGVPGCAQRLAINKFLRFAESSQRVSPRREIHRHRTAQHAHGPAHLHLQVIMLPPVTDVPRRGAQTLRQGASASVPLAPPDGANSLRFWPTSIRPELPDPSRQPLGLQRHAAAG